MLNVICSYIRMIISGLITNIVEWNVNKCLYFMVDCHLNILKISSTILKLCCEVMHEGHEVCCDDRNKSCYGKISCPLGWFLFAIHYYSFLIEPLETKFL